MEIFLFYLTNGNVRIRVFFLPSRLRGSVRTYIAISDFNFYSPHFLSRQEINRRADDICNIDNQVNSSLRIIVKVPSTRLESTTLIEFNDYYLLLSSQIISQANQPVESITKGYKKQISFHEYHQVVRNTNQYNCNYSAL